MIVAKNLEMHIDKTRIFFRQVPVGRVRLVERRVQIRRRSYRRASLRRGPPSCCVSMTLF